MKIDEKDKASLTPMMAQYVEISQANPDTLLFYRMGDFYELFFDDAETASRVLGIALTHRGTHLGKPIPMAGVPHHAATDYLHKLIDAGYKVSICEQVEDPAEAKKRGAKSVVRREVRRIATPGTLTEDTLLRARASNYLLAVMRDAASHEPLFGLAWTDISTGEFQFTTVSNLDLSSELSRLQPREILVPETLANDDDLSQLLEGLDTAISPLPVAAFDSEAAKEKLANFYDVPDPDLMAAHRRVELSVAGAILSYINTTQLGVAPPLQLPEKRAMDHHMSLDAATLANLEVLKTTSGERKGSLLDVVDVCVSAPGSREMALRLGAPLINPEAIAKRLDATGFFFDHFELCAAVRKQLSRLPDILRALSRLALERGEPRDLAAIRDGIITAEAIRLALPQIGADDKDLPELLQVIKAKLAFESEQIANQLNAALDEKLPPTKREGGFIRKGFDSELDEARLLRDDSRKLIAALQAHYIEDTGVKALKIKHNNVLGYFIEVPARAGEDMLNEARGGNQTYLHRQSMANAHRFTTRKLDDLQVGILAANDKALARELALFEGLKQSILAEATSLQGLAEALSAVDCYAALALVADQENWVRPEVGLNLDFELIKARHPVVEAAVRRDGQHTFVANDCNLSANDHEKGNIMLLTGPNMAGKSTYLRQNALIAILAQMGAFVPAQKARIGVVDKLFSRVGASDDLARGRSTFMVEMVETAAILNQSTAQSLVILDEIGRGTATFDGLSIAWASIEHLHEVNHCRCLFATHFHELTALERKLPRLNNATIKVKEWKQDVIFLHEVTSGVAAGSYGIQVGKLAGLPASVITRARDVLSQLEKEERTSVIERMIDDLPLFAHQGAEPKDISDPASELITSLCQLDVDNMTPRQALDQLFSLVGEARALDRDT